MFLQKSIGRPILKGGFNVLRPSLFSMPMMNMNASAAAATRQVETVREKEERKWELSKLMDQYVCKVGFEFHVQMKTKYKMFSSKFLLSI